MVNTIIAWKIDNYHEEGNIITILLLPLGHIPNRYIPDVYLTWELETEQRFTCLYYQKDRRVAAAIGEFTSFASVWWSEHCRSIN